MSGADSEDTDGAELIGTLRRKKEEHGRFEDAWKEKVRPPLSLSPSLFSLSLSLVLLDRLRNFFMPQNNHKIHRRIEIRYSRFARVPDEIYFCPRQAFCEGLSG